MIKRTFSTVMLLLIIASLRAGEGEPTTLKACRITCDDFIKDISKSLHDDILDKGITGAISTCAEKVDALCREYSRKPGLTVERITIPILNREKRLKSFESKALKKMIDAREKGLDISYDDYLFTRISEKASKTIYIRAIKVEPLCLICHGPSSMVQPEVKMIMKEKYSALPSDDKVGDIKGALLVSLALPEGESFLNKAEQSNDD